MVLFAMGSVLRRFRIKFWNQYLLLRLAPAFHFFVFSSKTLNGGLTAQAKRLNSIKVQTVLMILMALGRTNQFFVTTSRRRTLVRTIIKLNRINFVLFVFCSWIRRCIGTLNRRRRAHLRLLIYRPLHQRLWMKLQIYNIFCKLLTVKWTRIQNLSNPRRSKLWPYTWIFKQKLLFHSTSLLNLWRYQRQIRYNRKLFAIQLVEFFGCLPVSLNSTFIHIIRHVEA